MRITSFLMASVLFIGTTISAHASAYSCVATKDQKLIGTCTIDLNKRCQGEFSDTVIGVCRVDSIPNEPREILACFFVAPKLGPSLMSEAQQFDTEESIESVAEKPGFWSLGRTIVQADSPGNINSWYRESDTDPIYAMVCSR